MLEAVLFGGLCHCFFFFMEKRPTSCSWVFSEERSGVLRVRLGEGEAGFRNSSSTESELDMASPGFSVSPAAENTTITLGRGSVRLSWMKRLTRVAAGSGLKDRDWRSLLLQPSEPLEPLEPFCCMRAAGQLSTRQVRHKAELATVGTENKKKKERAGAEGVARAAASPAFTGAKAEEAVPRLRRQQRVGRKKMKI